METELGVGDKRLREGLERGQRKLIGSDRYAICDNGLMGIFICHNLSNCSHLNYNSVKQLKLYEITDVSKAIFSK